jgi:hypothetical protein
METILFTYAGLALSFAFFDPNRWTYWNCWLWPIATTVFALITMMEILWYAAGILDD